VDAVCEVPYGGYPGTMAYEYFSDEEHLREWLKVEEDPVAFKNSYRKTFTTAKITMNISTRMAAWRRCSNSER